MSESRLLIDIEVLDFLRTLRTRDQRDLLKRFRQIASQPSTFSDYVGYDSAGRRVEVHVFREFAIKFWDDLLTVT